MILIDQKATILNLWPSDPLTLIESAGRVCYQSEPRGDTAQFVRSLISRGHHSVIEHGGMTVQFITDRGVTHELVRHRLAAYSQESTRYVKYTKGDMVFIRPVWFESVLPLQEYLPGRDYWLPAMVSEFIQACIASELSYRSLMELGQVAQQARQVLNNSIKTEIYMTANFREWRHVFELRCAPAAHPQMRALMRSLLSQAKQLVPVFFDDME